MVRIIPENGMPKIIIVIPTYNEAENLPVITEALFNLGVEGLEVLNVDDGSPDGTGQIADRLHEQYPGRFHAMHRIGQRGLGAAYIQGFTQALDQGADVVVQMDADFSHSPGDIPRMLEMLEAYDVVVGSRYIKGGKTDERWGKGRLFLSWWANSVWVRLALGVRTKDATAGFKCWRASALKKMELESIGSNGYIFQVEMCYIAEKRGLRICEIPIYFEDRRVGQSKMDTREKIDAALGVFKIRRHWR
jgi:dolichol-phosphate mannosyltransferase